MVFVAEDGYETGCWCFKGKVSPSDRVKEIYFPHGTGKFKLVEEYHRRKLVSAANTQAARDLWWNKLYELYRIENEKEPCATNIQVMYYDTTTNIEYCKTFSVGPEETARDCIKVALEHLEMRNLDTDQFQLWAKTAREESPYPLIGHEKPFAIKLSCLRDSLSSEEGFDLDHCNNIHDPVARCHFILRSVTKAAVNENKKSFKKLSTRGMRIGHVFRRSISKEQSGCLFGLPLSKLSDGECLPKPVMGMLYQVFAKGPFIQGIFRKSANARLVRELREKLDGGEDVSWEHIPVLVTAALLKDFLRSLPDPLLTTALYPQWRAAIEIPNTNTKLFKMKSVLVQLPKANHLLLVHFLCVLYHIARRSCHTLMSAANLGVCVGPSLLWSSCPNVGDDLRVVPAIVECLISNCEFLCGSHIPSLLGDLRDSGTEESDSMKRDDSSIDSLECSPPPRKDKMSLSRDSGLTMSDSQLYTPDEEESGSTSSSGYDPAFESHSKISPSMSVPSNYVRVYGGWEERLNPNFQRQAWFRQRSRRANSTVNNKSDVRRSASEESLLDSKPPPTPPRRNKPQDYQETPQYPATYKKMTIPVRRIEHLSQKPDSGTERNCCEINADPLRITSCNRDFKVKPFFNAEDGFNQSVTRKVNSTKCDLSDNTSRDFNLKNNAIKENHYTNLCTVPLSNGCTSSRTDEKTTPLGFGAGDCYYSAGEQVDDIKISECEDSSTLSDEDCTPHVSRSNSRGNEVSTLRHVPPVRVDNCVIRGRLKRKEERAAYRSRSVPPPPPYRPPPPATSRRAPITSYYLGDCDQPQKYVITRTFMDEESYV